MSSDTHHKVYDATLENLQDVVWKLEGRARMLTALGLDKLGADLYEFSRIVEKAEAFFRADSIRVSNERFKDAQRSTGTMLSALLTGLELGEKKKDV